MLSAVAKLIFPLIQALADKYNAIVFVDECHATGFFGKTGRGTEEFFGMQVNNTAETSVRLTTNYPTPKSYTQKKKDKKCSLLLSKKLDQSEWKIEGFHSIKVYLYMNVVNFVFD